MIKNQRTKIEGVKNDTTWPPCVSVHPVRCLVKIILCRKSDFLNFTCIRNEGVTRGSGRGHRDFGPKINKMASAHLCLSHSVLKA